MKKTILFSFVTASLTFLVFRFAKIGFFHFFKNKQERNFPFEEGYYNFQNPIKGIDFSKLDSSFFFEKLTTNYREELCKLTICKTFSKMINPFVRVLVETIFCSM